MKRVREALCLLVLALMGLACERTAAPHLVAVTGVVSDRLSEGERLEIRGSGFPEGRPARVTLRGELHRPGRPVERRFSLALPAHSLSPHLVAVELTRELERALVGSEREHTTFRGSLEVAFFPARAGAPPVTGGLAELALDLVPLARPAGEARLAEAERFLDFSGILLGERAGPLLVEGVLPGSPAERASLQKGDELVALGGLRLFEPLDLIPPPELERVALSVRRPGQATLVPLALDLAGLRRLSPADLLPAAALLAAVLILTLLLRSPLGRGVSYLEHRLIELLRASRKRRRLAPRHQAPALHESRRPLLAIPLPACLALSLVAGVLTWLAIGRSLVAREVDGVVLLLASSASTAVAVLIFGVRGIRGLMARLARVLYVLAHSLFLALVLGVAAVASRGFGLDAFLLEQGAWPWDWNAFRDPPSLVALVLLVASLVPEAAASPSGIGRAGADEPRAGEQVIEVASWAGLFVVSGLAAFAFLGATRLPGVVPSSALPLAPSLAGAAVLLLKSTFLMLAVAGVRRVLGRVGLSEASGLSLRALFPLAVATLALSLLLREGGFDPRAGAAAAVLGAACFAGTLITLLIFARRVAVATLGRDAEPGVNPWI